MGSRKQNELGQTPMKDFQALNLGLLDLQNWNSNENHIPPEFNNNTPLAESSFSRIKKKIQETPNGVRGKPVDQMAEDVVDDHFIQPFSAGVPHSFPFPLPLGDDVVCPNHTRATPLRTRSLEPNHSVSKKHDLHMYEQPVLKSTKFSSPNTRFSLGLGKIARSYSLKEKTNQASPDSACSKRSSPLRRFLDPLLKPKGPPLAEKVHNFVNDNELLRIKKHGSSSVQALLKLTLKNGIPFFKFVVEGSSDLLAAAVKKLPSGKDDRTLVYAFYSVRETKKKSGGWIHQSSKEKGYSFEYNIVGQMKNSSSYHDEYVVRESVLYSTAATLDCRLEGELAAIIVKNLSGETCGDIESSRTTIVLLPDCVHSWPISGSPTALITRWRSGGACDCGGWDIGCRFHVLSSHQNEIQKTSTSSVSNQLELCYQIGLKNKCGFRLVSVADGLYSVEYDPSMSLLQAFSICVAVVSSHKLTHIFRVVDITESKDLCNPILTDNEKD